MSIGMFVFKEEFVIMRPKNRRDAVSKPSWVQSVIVRPSKDSYRGFVSAPAIFDTEQEAQDAMDSVIQDDKLAYKNIILVRRVIVHEVLRSEINKTNPYAAPKVGFFPSPWMREINNQVHEVASMEICDFTDAEEALGRVINRIAEHKDEIAKLTQQLATHGVNL